MAPYVLSFERTSCNTLIFSGSDTQWVFDDTNGVIERNSGRGELVSLGHNGNRSYTVTATDGEGVIQRPSLSTSTNCSLQRPATDTHTVASRQAGHVNAGYLIVVA